MEWVTSLQHNPFEQARLKLTAYYLGAMIFIISIFSFVLLSVIEKNLSDTLSATISDPHQRHVLFENTQDMAQAATTGADIFILVIIGCMSYFLAGKTLKPIKKNLDLQKRFTADASHDLRTPLTIMRTEMEVALQANHTDPDTYKKVLRSGLEEIKAMSTLVEDLLTLARGENINEKQMVRIEYASCLYKILEKVQAQADEKDILLTKEINVNGSVLAHESNLVRAIQNILLNAIHYTPKGGSIRVNLSKKNHQFLLTIEDTGVGISEQDLVHIFERFYKASHSRNDETGSGLGLSIAKEFIEKFNGEISISSTLQKGTLVTITLPIA